MFSKFITRLRRALEIGVPNIDRIPPAFSNRNHRADVGLLTDFDASKAKFPHLPGATAGLWR